MLTTIENFYLNVLRVVILVGATVAILVCGYGFLKVAPLISSLMASHTTQAMPQPTLGDFITEQKASGTPATNMPEATSATPPVSPRLQSALDHLSRYSANRMGGAVDMASARDAILSKRDTVNSDYQDDYDSSLDNLMASLEHSTGTPLDLDHLNTLLNWHLQKFNALVTKREGKITEDRQTGLLGLAIAGSGLVTFLLIISCFLAVKIERNLRLVHVKEIGSKAESVQAASGERGSAGIG